MVEKQHAAVPHGGGEELQKAFAPVDKGVDGKEGITSAEDLIDEGPQLAVFH